MRRPKLDPNSIESIVKVINHVWHHWRRYHKHCKDCALKSVFKKAGWRICEKGAFKIAAIHDTVVVKWGEVESDRKLYDLFQAKRWMDLLPKVYHWDERFMIQERVVEMAFDLEKRKDGYDEIKTITDKFSDRGLRDYVNDIADNHGNFGRDSNGNPKIVDAVIKNGLNWSHPDRVCGRNESYCGHGICYHTRNAEGTI